MYPNMTSVAKENVRSDHSLIKTSLSKVQQNQWYPHLFLYLLLWLSEALSSFLCPIFSKPPAVVNHFIAIIRAPKVCNRILWILLSFYEMAGHKVIHRRQQTGQG